MKRKDRNEGKCPKMLNGEIGQTEKKICLFIELGLES